MIETDENEQVGVYMLPPGNSSSRTNANQFIMCAEPQVNDVPLQLSTTNFRATKKGTMPEPGTNEHKKLSMLSARQLVEK